MRRNITQLLISDRYSPLLVSSETVPNCFHINCFVARTGCIRDQVESFALPRSNGVIHYGIVDNISRRLKRRYSTAISNVCRCCTFASVLTTPMAIGSLGGADCSKPCVYHCVHIARLSYGEVSPSWRAQRDSIMTPLQRRMSTTHGRLSQGRCDYGHGWLEE